MREGAQRGRVAPKVTSTSHQGTLSPDPPISSTGVMPLAWDLSPHRGGPGWDRSYAPAVHPLWILQELGVQFTWCLEARPGETFQPLTRLLLGHGARPRA